MPEDALTEPWTCPTCATAVSTPYCATCGESRPSARELTMRGLFEQICSALSSIDGRLIRSFRFLVTRPGALTVAYVRGRRKPYLRPLPLFLVANVLFFATQSLTDANVFSSTLDSHLHNQDWSAYAQSLVTRRLEQKHTTLDLYAPVFDHAVVLNAKSFIILMVLPFALVLPIMFRRSQQPFVAHVVFSLHVHAFLLLLFCAALAISAVDVYFGGAGLSSDRMDKVLSVVNLAACAAYLYVATGAFYRASGALRFIKVLALTVAVAGIVLGYRFVLFLITLYGT